MTVHSTDRVSRLTGLDRISLRAASEPKTVFNNLGHLLTENLLHEAFRQLDGTKAVGIDKVSKAQYSVALKENISALIKQIRTGKYKPKPVRIVEILKEDGGLRPLALSCFEDKIVQWAVSKILEAIYEPVFLSCSYGFRPNRNCHDALRSLMRCAYAFKSGALVEIDIRKCFNQIPHIELKGFLQQKITDSRFLKLVETLITAPIIENGQTEATTRGCTQGSCLSPILSNIYLHHVIDEWFTTVSQTHLRGQAELIRYADDMVFTFENPDDARRIWQVLDKRVSKYGLNLHEEKSRLMESGSQCAKSAELAGRRMPAFEFLGFTCYWGKARKGFWRLKYKSRADRFTRTLKEIGKYLRASLNTTDTRETLKGVVRRVKGWVNYHAISDNARRVESFLLEVKRRMHKWMNRRGSRRHLNWENMLHWLERVQYPKAYKTISMFQTG